MPDLCCAEATASTFGLGMGFAREGDAGAEGCGSSRGGCRESSNPFSKALALPFPRQEVREL